MIIRTRKMSNRIQHPIRMESETVIRLGHPYFLSFSTLAGILSALSLSCCVNCKDVMIFTRNPVILPEAFEWLCYVLHRLRLPAVPGWELRAGFDWRLHRGGRQAVPLRVQPHNQRQASQWEHRRKCMVLCNWNNNCCHSLKWQLFAFVL